MPDTDREARLEEIREHMNDPQGYIAEKDWRRYARFLLTEVDRLRDALERIATGDMGDWDCNCPAGEIAHDRLKAKLEGEDEQD